METFFIVYVNADGSITTDVSLPKGEDAEFTIAHMATNWDIYQTAKQIVDEFESNILANKVAQAVIATLMPPVSTPADAIKDKLKERGINPESPAQDA